MNEARSSTFLLKSGRHAAATIWALAQKELRDALRNRWFLLYSAAFAVLALAFSYLAVAGAGVVGFAGFGRTSASLINLVMLIVPLMALTIGAQALAGERERGTLSYLLAQPIGRLEIVAGKLLGLSMSLLAALSLGFGASGLVMAANGTRAGDPAVFIRLLGLAFLLSVAMLSLGMLISAFTDKSNVAVGLAVATWLALVFVGDLGMMGTSLVLRLPADRLLWLSMTNPLQVFKMAAIVDLNATLDVLGPAGLLASRQYGDRLFAMCVGLLAIWSLAPVLAAYAKLARTGDL